jgi:hypothetical protein
MTWSKFIGFRTGSLRLGAASLLIYCDHLNGRAAHQHVGTHTPKIPGRFQLLDV